MVFEKYSMLQQHVRYFLIVEVWLIYSQSNFNYSFHPYYDYSPNNPSSYTKVHISLYETLSADYRATGHCNCWNNHHQAANDYQNYY